MRILFNALFPIAKCRLFYGNNKRTCVQLLRANYCSNDKTESIIPDKTIYLRTIMAAESLFQGVGDHFHGITVRSDKETCALDDFQKKLEDSLSFWRENNKRGIWFKVNLNQSEWIPILAKFGFKFHHAKEDFVTMYLWLPKDEVCNIPHYAHTLTGVGAVVINDQSQILVVSEKYNLFQHWKLPGGYVEPGENLVDAAIREVQEETSIKTEFETVLTFTQGHGRMFGCSDIYTVISLKPLTTEITKCDREIDKCEWMNLNDYLKHPHVFELNRFFVQKYLEYKKNNIKIDWYHGVHAKLKRAYTVYFVADKDGGITDLTPADTKSRY